MWPYTILNFPLTIIIIIDIPVKVEKWERARREGNNRSNVYFHFPMTLYIPPDVGIHTGIYIYKYRAPLLCPQSFWARTHGESTWAVGGLKGIWHTVPDEVDWWNDLWVELRWPTLVSRFSSGFPFYFPSIYRGQPLSSSNAFTNALV